MDPGVEALDSCETLKGRKRMTKAKLSKTSRDLLESFIDSTKLWGWTQESGYGKMVLLAESAFLCDKEALEARILKLEAQVIDLKRKCRA